MRLTTTEPETYSTRQPDSACVEIEPLQPRPLSDTGPRQRSAFAGKFFDRMGAPIARTTALTGRGRHDVDILHVDREQPVGDWLEEGPRVVARRIGNEDVVGAIPSDQLHLERLGDQNLIG